jgi:hypothetical protein
MRRNRFCAPLVAVIILISLSACAKNTVYTLVPSVPSIYTQGVIMGPYLEAVTGNSVFVLVETQDMMQLVGAEYGLTDAYGNTAGPLNYGPTGGGTYIQKIKLTGLTPGQYYHYRINKNGAVSDDFVFRTAPSSGTAFRFAWASDFQSGTGIHAKISKKIMEASPGFSIYGGDIASFASYVSIKDEFFLPEEFSLISSVPFMFTVGNHEGWGQASRAFYAEPMTADGGQNYYSFNYGDMHVLVLDSTSDLSPGSAQYNFAAADLAASAAKWKIVSVHHPAYWAGGIDYPPHDTASLRALADGVYKPNGVKVVLSGHFHYYQHNLVDGIHHMIIATAGGDLNLTETAAFTVSTMSTHCYALIDVDAVSMTLNVYNEYGTKVDGFLVN